jgi:hypothetical protein
MGNNMIKLIKFLIKRVKCFIKIDIPCFHYKIFKSSHIFTHNGENYKYWYHVHNTTWKNERAVEIPLVCKIMAEYKKLDILEVGNVLSHYFNIHHDVVDKYEKSEGVINQDVVDFSPQKKYDLIISISTLEHVGWDENPREPQKIFKAMDNLKNCLAPGGKLVVTLPIGSNPKLDKYLETGEIKFTENYYLKRISQDNRWIEVNSGFLGAEYGKPYNGANVLFLGIYKSKI